MKGSHLLGVALLALACAHCASSAEPRETSASAEPRETSASAEQAVTSARRVRVVAANLTSGNAQSYDPGDGQRILRGLDADVVLVQEFNVGGNTPAELRAFVDDVAGPSAHYFRERGGQIPNGIVSRFPIVASGSWDDPSAPDRGFAWARVDVPGPADLWAVSVHLLTASSQRDSEARALVNDVLAAVPAGAMLVVGGDMNTSSRTETCIRTLGRVAVTTGPYPVDRNGNDKTNATRKKAYDWVIASPSLEALRAPTTLGGTTFASGLVADTRVYAPITELAPARAGDSGARNMQHMAVVRDFALPSPTQL